MMQKSSCLNLEGIPAGDLMILPSAWSLLCSPWPGCQAFLRKVPCLGEKNEAKPVVCVTRARGTDGRCPCTTVEPRVGGGCCNRLVGLCSPQTQESCVAWKLKTCNNCPLDGLHNVELGYVA